MSLRALALLPMTALLLASPVRAAAPWEARDLTPVTLKPAPAAETLVLASNGTPGAVIALPGKPDRKLRNAANQLRLFIQKTSGAQLVITNKVPAGPAVVIGPCPEAQAAGIDLAALPPEGFAVKSFSNKIYIASATNWLDGACWGTFDFAERILGVRWFLPLPQTNGDDLGICVLPAATIAVAPLWYEDHPYFRKRVIWPDTSDPWHGAGLNMGPLHTFLRAGNSWPVDLKVHSPNWARTAYTNERPEVFQLKADGTRDLNVLCYSNPKTLESYLDQIQLFTEGKKYNLGIMNGQAITVSPADVELACYCPECRKGWDKAGGSLGTASKIMAGFVDRLARAVKQRWPDRPFSVIFLPYLNYTACPADIHFPNNVEVQICGMPGLAMYKEQVVRESEQANIDRWMAASGRKVQNWHYDVWPAHKTKAAYLYPHVAQRFYQENRDKTVGTFINGEYNHWPRQHISLYAWMKCLWNPDFPVDAAIDTFCERSFGAAARTMRELVGLQMDGWEKSKWPEGRFSPKAIYEISFPRDTVKKMEALYLKAREEAAADPLVMARLDYLKPDLEGFFKESKDMAEGTGFKPLLLQKVGDPPVIDGKLDEPGWERATPVAFIKATGKEKGQPAKYPTLLRGLWTGDGVYLGFRMTEPNIDLLETRHGGHDNGEVWWDDNVELFLDPTGKNEGLFYQIIINANLSTFDNKNKDMDWEATAMKTAVFKGPDFWSMEVFLPFSLFPEAVKPTPGAASTAFWTGNFTRHRVACHSNVKSDVKPPEGSIREYQRMNTTGSVTSDNLADFSEIRFTE